MKRIILLFATLFFVNVASCQKFSFPVEEFPEELRQDKHFEKASQGDIKALHDFAFACIYHKRPDLGMLCYKKASELGDAEASMKLAMNYWVGFGNSSENDSIFGTTEPLEKDSVASYKYAQLALKQDKTGEAHQTYGTFLWAGWYKDMEEKPASYFWIKAAEMGHENAQWHLANYYYDGEYIEQNYKEARKWYEKVLEQPDTLPLIDYTKSQSRQKLAEMYANGYGVEKNLEKAFDYYLAGNAWLKVAECYDLGRGVKQDKNLAAINYAKVLASQTTEDDYKIAEEWLLQRAKQKDTTALYALGNYYSEKGKKEDAQHSQKLLKGTAKFAFVVDNSDFHKKAFEFWKSAAEGGHVESIKKVINCYLRGTIVKADSVKATQWARKGVSLSNDKDLLWTMAWHNAKGIGTPVNKAEAVRWYTKAAEAGHITATTNLAWCYETGFGCQTNYKEAVKWYTIAADAGEMYAQKNLGSLYLRGVGVPKDETKAWELFKKSAAQGDIRSIGLMGVITQSNVLRQTDENSVTAYLNETLTFLQELSLNLQGKNRFAAAQTWWDLVENTTSEEWWTSMKKPVPTSFIKNFKSDPTLTLRVLLPALKDCDHLMYTDFNADYMKLLNPFYIELRECKDLASSDFKNAFTWLQQNAKKDPAVFSYNYAKLLFKHPELAQNPNEGTLHFLKIISFCFDTSLQQWERGNKTNASNWLGNGWKFIQLHKNYTLTPKYEHNTEQPLFVVDYRIQTDLGSIEVTDMTEEKFAQLFNLKPTDIGRINVLKGESAIKAYGNDYGKNGVIEIFTNKAQSKTAISENISHEALAELFYDYAQFFEKYGTDDDAKSRAQKCYQLAKKYNPNMIP